MSTVSEPHEKKTVPTLSAADHAVVTYIASLLRTAILRRADTEADRVADRVVARLALSSSSAASLSTTAPSSPTTTAPAPSLSISGAATLAVTNSPTALDEPPPILLSVASAARLLGCSAKALYHRLDARHIPASCIVRSGRRVLFHRERLLAAVERKAGR